MCIKSTERKTGQRTPHAESRFTINFHYMSTTSANEDCKSDLPGRQTSNISTFSSSGKFSKFGLRIKRKWFQHLHANFTVHYRLLDDSMFHWKKGNNSNTLPSVSSYNTPVTFLCGHVEILVTIQGSEWQTEEYNSIIFTKTGDKTATFNMPRYMYRNKLFPRTSVCVYVYIHAYIHTLDAYIHTYIYLF